MAKISYLVVGWVVFVRVGGRCCCEKLLCLGFVLVNVGFVELNASKVFL